MPQYSYIEKTLKGAACFSVIGEQSAQAQAAVLLMLGRQLRGDDAATEARAKKAAVGKKVSLTGLRRDADFPVPRLKPSARRLPQATTAANVRKRHGARALDATSGAWRNAYHDSAERLFDKPSIDAAANLFEICLIHPMDLVCISAAAAYFPISAEPSRLIEVLATACKSRDPLERQVAATALARIDPMHRALRALSRALKPPRRKQRAHTAMVIHGTFASDAPWWQPGGDFHTFIKGFRPDLYSRADRFQWTGGYSDGARADGAATLRQWVSDHSERGLDLIGHSHGANVMLLATASGMKAGKLVLLSCPVHVDKYFPDFNNCTTVHSVRVKLDLVILADRGGQKFEDPRIKENVLPIWFNHSATHDPAVWTKYSIPQKIKL